MPYILKWEHNATKYDPINREHRATEERVTEFCIECPGLKETEDYRGNGYNEFRDGQWRSTIDKQTYVFEDCDLEEARDILGWLRCESSAAKDPAINHVYSLIKVRHNFVLTPE